MSARRPPVLEHFSANHIPDAAKVDKIDIALDAFREVCEQATRLSIVSLKSGVSSVARLG